MTIAPLGQHTYDGCLIRALCVWGGGREGRGGGGRRKFNMQVQYKLSAYSMQSSVAIEDTKNFKIPFLYHC